MKKLILSAVVVAAAIFGAYTANQTNDEIASLGLLNVVDLEAEASYGSSFEVISDTDIPLGIMQTGSLVQGQSTVTTVTEIGQDSYCVNGSFNYTPRTRVTTVATKTTHFECNGNCQKSCMPKVNIYVTKSTDLY